MKTETFKVEAVLTGEVEVLEVGRNKVKLRIEDKIGWYRAGDLVLITLGTNVNRNVDSVSGSW